MNALGSGGGGLGATSLGFSVRGCGLRNRSRRAAHHRSGRPERSPPLTLEADSLAFSLMPAAMRFVRSSGVLKWVLLRAMGWGRCR